MLMKLEMGINRGNVTNGNTGEAYLSNIDFRLRSLHIDKQQRSKYEIYCEGVGQFAKRQI